MQTFISLLKKSFVPLLYNFIPYCSRILIWLESIKLKKLLCIYWIFLRSEANDTNFVRRLQHWDAIFSASNSISSGMRVSCRPHRSLSDGVSVSTVHANTLSNLKPIPTRQKKNKKIIITSFFKDVLLVQYSLLNRIRTKQLNNAKRRLVDELTKQRGQ
jgi:hypothetical protein